MADANSVVAKVQAVVDAANAALTEASAVAGQPVPPDQSAEVAALQAQVADLQGKIDTAKASLAAADAADATEDQARAAALAALG